MGVSYLSRTGKSWKEITRDERTFCMYLFHEFKDRPLDLVNLVRNNETKITSISNGEFVFNNKVLFDPVDDDWELGYEVCFYRDVLKEFGEGIKDKADFPDKRTFDLCLFSENHIVIIEAKSHEDLNKAQFQGFAKDRTRISKLFEFLRSKKDYTDFVEPIISFVLLTQSGFYNSKSFSQESGLGHRFIVSKMMNCESRANAVILSEDDEKADEDTRTVDAILSWKDIYQSLPTSNPQTENYCMLCRADSV